MVDLNKNIEVVLVGGSAGSLPVLIQLLKSLPSDFALPVIIVMHRQRNVLSELTKILSSAIPFKNIVEPDDKLPVGSCCIYIAPQNYHLLIEKDKSFSLDYSEAIQYSRPSIDVTFESVARVYKNKVAAILLSGANNDGTLGLMKVVEAGGIAIAQDPDTAEYTAMPLSAVEKVAGIKVMKPAEIGEFMNGLV